MCQFGLVYVEIQEDKGGQSGDGLDPGSKQQILPDRCEVDVLQCWFWGVQTVEDSIGWIFFYNMLGLSAEVQAGGGQLYFDLQID